MPHASYEEDLHTVIYGPEPALRRPLLLLRRMVGDLGVARSLAWALYLRNVRSEHRQSLLGYLWVLLPPLVNTLLWVFLNNQKIVNVEIPNVPYPVYVLTGTVLWQFVVDAIRNPLQIVSQARPMMSKLSFPCEALPIAATLQVLSSGAVRLVFLGGVLVWFGADIATTAIWFPLGIITLIMLGTTIGMLLIPAGMLYGDVERFVVLALQAGFYLTPVIYPAPTQWPATLINQLNPVSPLLSVTRELLLTGDTSQLLHAGIVVAVTIPALFLSWVMFRISLPLIIERMST